MNSMFSDALSLSAPLEPTSGNKLGMMLRSCGTCDRCVVLGRRRRTRPCPSIQRLDPPPIHWNDFHLFVRSFWKLLTEVTIERSDDSAVFRRESEIRSIASNSMPVLRHLKKNLERVCNVHKYYSRKFCPGVHFSLCTPTPLTPGCNPTFRCHSLNFSDPLSKFRCVVFLYFHASNHERLHSVPTITWPLFASQVVAMKYPCKKYLSEQKKFLSSDEYKAIMKKFESLGNFLIKYAGGPFNTLDYFEYLYSTLQIEKNNNLTLPEWTNGVYPDQLLAPAGLSFATPTWTPGMKRLRGGPLVKEIMVNMEEKIAGKLNPPSQNISIYSAHDTTVAAFLNSLDMFNFLPPPFASMVLLELRKTAQNDYAVVVLYKNSTDPTVDPHILTVPGCFDACPIKDMEALIQPIIPGDWDSECHQHEFFDLTSDQPYNSVAIF
ncbi:unnamed protein product, partial [Nesidiocoris tenuis]